ncbi:MAG: rod shape-determining protein MreD [Chloroflexota bacterium]
MKTPWWIAPCLLFVAALLQAAFFPALGLVRARPELVVTAVAIWAVLRGVREALPWAFIGGLLLDLFSQGPFGTAALALVIVAFCSSVGEASVFRTNFLLPTVIVFWASVLYGVIYLFLLRTHQMPVDWIGTLRHSVVPSALLSTACAPIVYWLLSRVERKTRSIVPVEW